MSINNNYILLSTYGMSMNNGDIFPYQNVSDERECCEDSGQDTLVIHRWKWEVVNLK